MADENCIETTAEETCELKSFERNKYFYGKLMTVRDFETEQRYFNRKRHLLNRLVHGVGLVCGLEVSEPKLAGGKLQVKVAKGVALDCCGREIVVEGGAFDLEETPADGLNYLYLKYRECWKEPVPSLANPSVCEEVCCYSRTKEDFTLELGRTPPPEAPSFDWQQVWSDREPDIHFLAERSSAGEPQDEIEGKLAVTADEYHKETGCPECDDPRVLLAVIRVSGSTVTVDQDETLAARDLVYSNPMLHELLKSHLTDVGNPHHVTAEQAKALMSINNVGNAPDQEDWVQNVDIQSPDGTITVTPNAAAKSVEITTTHAQINPLAVDPASTTNVRDKHVSNADANRWNKSPASIDSLSNPGGDIDLVAGDNITIEHPAVPAGSPPQIKISAAGGPSVAGAITGVVHVTIPKATQPAEITHLAPAAPGHAIVRDILHHLETELPPAIVLGLESEKGIVMEQDFITQRQLVEFIARVEELPAPPPVYFKALKVDNKKFDVVAVNLSPEAEVAIGIRWWAIPAERQVKGIPPIRDLTDTIRDRLGGGILDTIAGERSISVSEVGSVIGTMIDSISAKREGLTVEDVATATGLKVETVQPVLDALTETEALKRTGTARTTRRFIINR